MTTKFIKSTQPSKKLSPKFIGLSSIVDIINPVTVKLQLPHNLKRLHPVFHSSLLKPASDLQRWYPVTPPPPPIMIDGHQHFEVKDILDFRKYHGSLQYLIRWKHFPDPEWVLASHVKALTAVNQFHTSYPEKPHP